MLSLLVGLLVWEPIVLVRLGSLGCQSSAPFEAMAIARTDGNAKYEHSHEHEEVILLQP